MKKALKILGITLGVLLLLAFVLPFLFRDRIATAVKTQLDQSLDAKVLLDPSAVSLSLFRSFPDFSLKIERFGLVNKAPFEGDTLFYADAFLVSLDFMSVVGGGPLSISALELDKPRIQVLVLPDGRANYAITKPDTAAPSPEAPAEPSAFQIRIDRWAIQDAEISYLDAQTGTRALLKGLNHSGSGDFSQEVVNIKSKTQVADLSLTLDSVNYLRHKQFDSELAVDWNLAQSKGTFGDNYVQLNAFRFGFAGSVDLGGPQPVLDLQFKTPETDIKGLLSLVPGIYSESFKDVQTGGTFSFSGSVKGKVDSVSLPAFQLAMGIQKGHVQYPGMPQKVEQINLDLGLQHPEGPLETLQTRIGAFGFRMGNNPFSLSGTVAGVTRPNLDLKAQGKLDLAQALAVFPVEGLQMKGLLSLALSAAGILDMEKQQYPVLNAALNLTGGYLKSKDFPQALEQVEMALLAENPSGKPEDTRVDLSRLHFQLEGQPFDMTARFANPADLRYEAKAQGKINLATMTRIFPLEGMKLEGLLDANLETKGILSDVTAKRYDKLPTSGYMALENFRYTAADLAKPVAISRARASFSSRELGLENMAMAIGESDFQLKGGLKNPLGYFLRNETLQGSLSLTSTKMNANELMALTGEEPAPATPAEETPMTVVGIPQNLDLRFAATVGTLLYDNLKLENARGAMAVQNGVLRVEKLESQALGGSVGAKGLYDPRNMARPGFDFAFDLKQVSISQAYEAFNSIQKLAPAAKGVQGSFTTLFAMQGFLKPDMKPEMETLSGAGLISLDQAQLRDLGLVQNVNALAKTKLPTESNVKDLKIKARIREGRLYFDPFDLKAGSQVLKIGGSNGLDGTVDYRISTVVPAGQAGAAVSTALQAFAGKSLAGGQNVTVELAATGPAAKPKYRIVRVDAGGAKEQVKTAVNDKLNQAKAEAEARAREEAERLKQEAEAKAKAEAERLKKEAEDKARKELEKVKKRLRF